MCNAMQASKRQGSCFFKLAGQARAWSQADSVRRVQPLFKLAGMGMMLFAALMYWCALPAPAHAQEETVEIASASDLASFASRVNRGETDLNAVLTSDIDLSGKTWSPIGPAEFRPFTGSFDGQGHTVRNLVNATPGEYGGMFGVVSGAHVQNLIVSGDSKVSNSRYVGGIAGFDMGGSVFERCQNEAQISGRTNAGGIVGRLGTGSKVLDCSNSGAITSQKSAGGIAAFCASGSSVESCLNVGGVNGSDSSATGAMIGAFSVGTTVRNSYSLEGASELSGGGEFKSADELASGEVAWLLNGETPSGAWKENLGEASYPSFEGGTVYKWRDNTYHNSLEPAPKPAGTLKVVGRTSVSIEVEGLEPNDEYGGLEFSIDGSAWQTSPLFEGLTPHTSYVIYARHAGNGSWAPSESVSVAATTKQVAPKVVQPSGLSGTVGQALSSVALPNGWAWETPDAVMEKTGTIEFDAALSVDDEAYDYDGVLGYDAKRHAVVRALSVAVAEKDASSGGDDGGNGAHGGDDSHGDGGDSGPHGGDGGSSSGGSGGGADGGDVGGANGDGASTAGDGASKPGSNGTPAQGGSDASDAAKQAGHNSSAGGMLAKTGDSSSFVLFSAFACGCIALAAAGASVIALKRKK